MRSLAELRDAPVIGEVVFRIPGDDPVRPLLFHDAARTAYYLTVDALRNFGQADAIGPGPFVVPGIALWFMATESYISLVYKALNEIAAVARAEGRSLATKNGELKRTEKIVEKLVAIKLWAAGGDPPDAPRNRLQEFATFRNTLFHDLTAPSLRTRYEHTCFAPRAEKCNQVDLFEAMRVSLDVFSFFRYLFATVDLMPSIQLETVVEKVDALAGEVLEPALAEILAAKGLAWDPPPNDRAVCSTELPVALEFMIGAEGPTAPTKPSDEPRLAVDRLQELASAARPVDDEMFHVPNYYRQQ